MRHNITAVRMAALRVLSMALTHTKSAGGTVCWRERDGKTVLLPL